MKIVALILGVIASLLGGLWLLQGLGIIHIEPIACVAACEPMQGPSPLWAAIGTAVLAAGVLAIVSALRRRPKRGEGG